ncbi:MAG: hydrogenase maturation protease [Thermoanaerobaculia bacterium]
MEGPGRVIVGGIGYRNLRDHSVGVAVADCLAGRDWPEGVVVEDLSYNPIAVLQRLEDEPADRRFARAVLVAGVQRGGRRPGSVTAYRWDCALPSPDEIQRAVTEAVTGVISLDNTLVVTRYFGALPDEVAVIEVEPALHEFGDELGPEVAGVFATVCELVTRLAGEAGAAARLPRAALGGGVTV